jgi:hypothetical protein
MKDVRVKRMELLAKVQTNRDKHAAEVKEARQEYRAARKLEL